MAGQKIFVVDDEEEILDLIEFILLKEKYQVKRFITGEDILQAIPVEKPDMILLDLMLPGVDGFDVCREIKREKTLADIPIIMLTAKGEETDIVSGLELGADDYIIKPFSSRVLVARMKAVFRRKKRLPAADDELLRVNEITIHPGRHEVTIDGKPVVLTYSEFRLLQLLAQKRGWVYTRYQIVDALRGSDYPVTERAIDVQIVGLRKKMGAFGHYIETVRGVGYRFKDEE